MSANQSSLLTKRLTPRQRECVDLLCKGLTSKEIARELGISPSTVDNHISIVMHSLNIQSRALLLKFEIEEEKIFQKTENYLTPKSHNMRILQINALGAKLNKACSLTIHSNTAKIVFFSLLFFQCLSFFIAFLSRIIETFVQ